MVHEGVLSLVRVGFSLEEGVKRLGGAWCAYRSGPYPFSCSADRIWEDHAEIWVARELQGVETPTGTALFLVHVSI